MNEQQPSNTTGIRLVIITGLSGSGMSSATNAFEDLGFFCVDNLPPTMMSTFARLLFPTKNQIPAIERAALVIDIRSRQFLAQFAIELKKLKSKGIDPMVVFFEASDDVLRRRFSETRRPHPNDKGKGLLESIKEERTAMAEISELADLHIDTSDLTVHTLRTLILNKFSNIDDNVPLNVQIVSFGHKFGGPRDADLMFDVRHLPNPYFNADLKHLSGLDEDIVKFLREHDVVNETITRLEDLLIYLLPYYKNEGKSYLTIAIGCTGGRHRSVMTANTLANTLMDKGYNVSILHRDMQK